MLSRLWLHEPSAADVERAVHELGLPRPDGESPVSELAEAYANIFLLNVFPYGSTFTDSDSELNAASARLTTRAFEERGFAPHELGEVAAADHLGLCLAFLEGIDDQSTTSSPLVAEFLDDFTQWAPVCCLAVEREPGGHPFYRALAERTRSVVLQRARMSQSHAPEQAGEFESIAADPLNDAGSSEDEIRLSDILRFFLSPARCGAFLSRARLGHIALQLSDGIRLPFGTRYEVARSLFTAAGEAAVVEQLLNLLAKEIAEWDREYRSWKSEYPAWENSAWLSKTRDASHQLAELRATADSRAAR